MGDSAADGTATGEPGSSLDVAVIGAGQAGLAMGCFLARHGRRFVILDRAGSGGATVKDDAEFLAERIEAHPREKLPALISPARAGVTEGV